MRGSRRPDPLDYWYTQECEALEPSRRPVDLDQPDEDAGVVPGWWILPLVFFSLLAWAGLAAAAL